MSIDNPADGQLRSARDDSYGDRQQELSRRYGFGSHHARRMLIWGALALLAVAGVVAVLVDISRPAHPHHPNSQPISANQ